MNDAGDDFAPDDFRWTLAQLLATRPTSRGPPQRPVANGYAASRKRKAHRRRLTPSSKLFHQTLARCREERGYRVALAPGVELVIQ
jgi:hypothetical protein